MYVRYRGGRILEGAKVRSKQPKVMFTSKKHTRGGTENRGGMRKRLLGQQREADKRGVAGRNVPRYEG